MADLPTPLVSLDRAITQWMAKYGVGILRVALGVVFLWFGFLKYFPGVSSEEELATRTINVLTLGLMPAHVSRVLLATWECAIGLGLLTSKAMRTTLLLLFAQMLGTLMPLVLFPAETFARFPVVPTLQGQFIIKNFIFIAAAIVMGATVRGGRVVADPVMARVAAKADERKSS
ncbi:MAG: hypothetical protein ABIV10_13865 [Gemmatimonadaceae bacterium]